MYLLDRLVQTLPEDEQDLLAIDWYFLPVLNPDGYEYTRNEANDRLWRKTRCGTQIDSSAGAPPYPLPIPLSLHLDRNVIPENICLGTDANRNFGVHWNEGGSSDQSCSNVYHGPEPFSEVELRNMRDFIVAQGDAIVFYQNLHTAAQLVLYPWAYECGLDPNPDAEDQDALAGRVKSGI